MDKFQENALAWFEGIASESTHQRGEPYLSYEAYIKKLIEQDLVRKCTV